MEIKVCAMVLLRYLFIILILVPSFAKASEIIDATGTVVKIPDQIAKVAPAGPPASVFLYTLAPDLMMGWPSEIGEKRREFLGQRAVDMPVIGSLGGRVGSEANIERFLLAKPDVIIDLGNVGTVDLELAQMVRKRTNIPYILFDGSLDNFPKAYREIGKAINKPDEGEKRALWLENHMKAVKTAIDQIPQDKRPRIYYARGVDGKETGRSGSIHAEVIERAGAINAVDANIGSQGILQLSMDHILALDPDIIIASNPKFMETIASDPLWQHLRAVKNNKVYLAPSMPYSWIDVPPSVNRAIGVIWLTHILYPENYDVDIKATAGEFYDLFYHITLDDKAFDDLMISTQPQKTGSQ